MQIRIRTFAKTAYIFSRITAIRIRRGCRIGPTLLYKRTGRYRRAVPCKKYIFFKISISIPKIKCLLTYFPMFDIICLCRCCTLCFLVRQMHADKVGATNCLYPIYTDEHRIFTCSRSRGVNIFVRLGEDNLCYF